MSLGLRNVVGVTKRRVENEDEVDGACGTTVASDTAFDDWMGCRVVSTSDFGTAENVIFEWFNSVESRASLLFGWCGSTLSV